MIDREGLLRLTYQVSKPNCSLEQYAVALGEWDLIPLEFSGKLVGALIENKGAVHVAILPEYQKCSAYWRAGLAKYIQPLLDLHGTIYTMLKFGDVRGGAFVYRLGFMPVDADHEYMYYELKKITFGRGRKCQQQS